jgi:hypothetical protein
MEISAGSCWMLDKETILAWFVNEIDVKDGKVEFQKNPSGKADVSFHWSPVLRSMLVIKLFGCVPMKLGVMNDKYRLLVIWNCFNSGDPARAPSML